MGKRGPPLRKRQNLPTELYRQKARDKLDIRSKLMGDSYFLDEMKEMMEKIIEKKQASGSVVNELDELD